MGLNRVEGDSTAKQPTLRPAPECPWTAQPQSISTKKGWGCSKYNNLDTPLPWLSGELFGTHRHFRHTASQRAQERIFHRRLISCRRKGRREIHSVRENVTRRISSARILNTHTHRAKDARAMQKNRIQLGDTSSSPVSSSLPDVFIRFTILT